MSITKLKKEKRTLEHKLKHLAQPQSDAGNKKKDEFSRRLKHVLEEIERKKSANEADSTHEEVAADLKPQSEDESATDFDGLSTGEDQEPVESTPLKQPKPKGILKKITRKAKTVLNTGQRTQLKQPTGTDTEMVDERAYEVLREDPK